VRRWAVIICNRDRRENGERSRVSNYQVQAENLKLRSSLMVALKRHIERKGLSQAEAAKVFGVTQPRISNLMRGKIELFGLDMLVNMLATAGMRVTMRVKKAP
jgi:predicted XRE-type DNA-binding protein